MNDAPRQKLRELIAQYGPSLIDDPRRCEALLRDFCGQYKREINVLIGALREKVATELLASTRSLPGEVIRARLANRLQDHLALSEQASRWAVESWALALGLDSAAGPEADRLKPVPASAESLEVANLDDPFEGDPTAVPGMMTPEELLRQAARVILADNQMSEFERADLRVIRQRLGVPVEEARRIIAQVKAEKQALGHNRQTAASAPPTLTVSLSGDGQYTAITEAARIAQPGTRILVRPGLYKENLVINKAVEIIGDGHMEQVVIESAGVPCVVIEGDGVVIRRLSLRARGVENSDNCFALEIASGQSVIEECGISSQASACISIHGPKTNAHIRRCKIHDGGNYGVWIWDNAEATLEDCEIYANDGAGVVISGDTMEEARQMAEYMSAMSASGLGAIGALLGEAFDEPESSAMAKAVPVIRRCSIHSGKGHGMWVHYRAAANIEGCHISNNAMAGVWINQESEASIRDCFINENDWEAVRVTEASVAAVEGCDLRANRGGAWAIERGCEVTGDGNKQ